MADATKPLWYPAILTTEGSSTLARFPDCPGCQTQADGFERIEDQAKEALEGWLESTVAAGQDAPLPSVQAPALAPGERVLWVYARPPKVAR